MLGEIIRLLLAAACFLFVLSLPLARTDGGAVLRRWAGVCLVLAFLPSLVAGIFHSEVSPSSPATTSNAGAAASFFSSLGCMTFVVAVIAVAYGILKLRSRLTAKQKQREPWEAFFNRGGGKRPFTMRTDRVNPRSSFAFGDEEDDD